MFEAIPKDLGLEGIGISGALGDGDPGNTWVSGHGFLSERHRSQCWCLEGVFVGHLLCASQTRNEARIEW